MAAESALEARCCALAVRLGCKAVKLGGFAVGLPDRLYLLPGGAVWLVEFKAPRGQVSLAQKYHFGALAELGHPVAVITSFTWFERDLYEKLGERRLAQKELDL